MLVVKLLQKHRNRTAPDVNSVITTANWFKIQILRHVHRVVWKACNRIVSQSPSLPLIHFILTSSRVQSLFRSFPVVFPLNKPVRAYRKLTPRICLVQCLRRQQFIAFLFVFMWSNTMFCCLIYVSNKLISSRANFGYQREAGGSH